MFCRKFGWPSIESIANQGMQIAVRMFIETSGECACHWTTKLTVHCVAVYNKSIECKVHFKYNCNSSSSMFVSSTPNAQIRGVGRINGLHITCVPHVFLVRSLQSRSPFRWTRVTWGTKSLGSWDKNYFYIVFCLTFPLLSLSCGSFCILPPACVFL